MKVVVTGGAGFIGSNLAEALVRNGEEVHVVDDLSLGKKENVPAGATFHQGSVTDASLLARVFRDATYVFHQAALGSVPRSIEDPMRSHTANATGTLNVLLAARDANVEKVVYAASSSAYGDTPTLPKTESMTPNPKSPYAVTKLMGEQYCQVFHSVYGLRTTALRYFNVYGPRQDPKGAYAAVIPRFILAALHDEALTIHGDGQQSRDFTFVHDVIQANLLAATSRDADGHVINIGAGGRTTINDLARMILQATGSRSRIVHAPARAGDVAHSLAGLERAERLLGYRAENEIRAGLAKTVAWFRSVHAPAQKTAMASSPH